MLWAPTFNDFNERVSQKKRGGVAKLNSNQVMEDLIKWNGKEKQTHGPRCDRARDSVCQIKGTKLHDCWVMISNRRKKCCILPQSGTCPDAQPPSVMLLCDQTLEGPRPVLTGSIVIYPLRFHWQYEKKMALKNGTKTSRQSEWVLNFSDSIAEKLQSKISRLWNLEKSNHALDMRNLMRSQTTWDGLLGLLESKRGLWCPHNALLRQGSPR